MYLDSSCGNNAFDINIFIVFLELNRKGVVFSVPSQDSEPQRCPQTLATEVAQASACCVSVPSHHIKTKSYSVT